MTDPSRRLVVAAKAGSVQHFYHFFFAVLVPILHRAGRGELEGVSLIESCGPMDAHLEEIDRSGVARLRISDRQVSAPEGVSEMGLISQECYDRSGLRADGYDSAVLQEAASLGKRRFSAGISPFDVVIVRRGDPDPFYDSEVSDKAGGGNRRRSIPNLEDIARSIRETGRGAQVVELEGKSLGEQVSIFASASAVVAQHGAALSNILWMSPNSLVVEVIPDGRKRREHFSRLADVMSVKHVAVGQQNGHSPVSPAAVVDALR